MSRIHETDLSAVNLSETEHLRSVITVKDACIANFSTTLRSIERKAAVERETLETQIAELEAQLRDARAYALENRGRARSDGTASNADMDWPSRSGMRNLDGASTPGELHARQGSQTPIRDAEEEVRELRERVQDMEKEKNKMEGRVLRAEASSADLLKELRSTYFQLDKTRAQLQEVMNSSDSRSPPPMRGEADSRLTQMTFEKEQEYQREIAELQLALRRAREEITSAAQYGRDANDAEQREGLSEVSRELDLLARMMGITNTDQLPAITKVAVLKKQTETWREQREKEGKLLEESKKGMVELLTEFKAKDQQLKEAQAVIAGKNKIFLSKSKPEEKANTNDNRAVEQLDPGTVGFTIAGNPPYEILEITHLIDRNGTPQGTPGCLNASVFKADRLMEVGGLDVTSASLSTLKKALLGPVDSCVTLRLLRPSTGQHFEITARRHVLMSPRSRATAGRQLGSPRSMVGSVPVSPRNLSSLPVSPRSLEASSGAVSPRSGAGALPVSVHGLAVHGGGGSTTPTLSSGSLASHTPGPSQALASSHAVASSPSGLLAGKAGQWSSTAARPLGAVIEAPPYSLSSAAGSLRPQPSYIPLQSAGSAPSLASSQPPPSRASAATTASSSQQLPTPGFSPAGNLSSPSPPPQAGGGASSPFGLREPLDPWAWDDPDGNIWTTNPGAQDPSLVLT